VLSAVVPRDHIDLDVDAPLACVDTARLARAKGIGGMSSIDSGARRRSMGHKYARGGCVQNMPREATEHQLTHTTVTICAHNEEIDGF
jgi:hypothetical protein